MIQDFRLTFILLLLNGFAFTGLFFLSNAQFKSNQDEHNLNFAIQEFTRDLDQIAIRGTELNESIQLNLKGQSWFLEQPIEWPANHYTVHQIIHQLNLLSEEARFSEKEILQANQSLSDFGLIEPALSIELGKGEKVLRIQLGNSTPLGNKLYLYLPQKDRIYVVANRLFQSQLLNLDNLRQKEIINIPNFEIEALNYQVRTSPEDRLSKLSVRIEKNLSDNTWHFNAPLKVQADASLVNQTIRELTTAQIEKFLPPEILDSEMLGFENPYMKLSLEGNKRRTTLILGNSVSDQNESKRYYAKLENNSSIFTVDSEDFDRFVEAHKALREKNFIRLDPASISTVDLSNASSQTKLQRLENNQWQVISLDQNSRTQAIHADHSIIDALLKNLGHLRAVDFFSDNPTEENLSALGFDRALLTIRLFDGEANILQLKAVHHPSNEALVLVNLEGHSSIYSVEKKSFLENFNPSPLNYKSRVIEKLPKAARISELQIIDLRKSISLLTYRLSPLDSEAGTTDSIDPSSTDTETTLFPHLIKMRAQGYVDQPFALDAVDSYGQPLWNYQILFKIILPGDAEDKMETRSYYLSARKSGSRQLGGTPSKNLIFELSPELIHALNPYINEFKPSPESRDLAVENPPSIDTLPENTEEAMGETP